MASKHRCRYHLYAVIDSDVEVGVNGHIQVFESIEPHQHLVAHESGEPIVNKRKRKNSAAKEKAGGSNDDVGGSADLQSSSATMMEGILQGLGMVDSPELG